MVREQTPNSFLMRTSLRTTSVSFTLQPCSLHLQPGLEIPLCRRRLGDQEGREEGGGRRRKGQGSLSLSLQECKCTSLTPSLFSLSHTHPQ